MGSTWPFVGNAMANGSCPTGMVAVTIYVVLAAELLVKVTHVKIKVLLLIQAQHFLNCFQWHALR